MQYSVILGAVVAARLAAAAVEVAAAVAAVVAAAVAAAAAAVAGVKVCHTQGRYVYGGRGGGVLSIFNILMVSLC